MPNLDHTIIHATDRFAAARFLTDLLDAPAPREAGPFAVVPLDNGVTLDFGEHLARGGTWVPSHYAITVTEEEFDAIFSRIVGSGLPYWSGPRHQGPQAINHLGGGRGVYVDDPDGNFVEFLTVSLSGAASGPSGSA